MVITRAALDKRKGARGVRRPAGDSHEQREVERYLFKKLKESLQEEEGQKVELVPDYPLKVNGDACVNLDAYCDEPRIFCEIWAHLGALKGSQSDKVMSDAMKLIYVSQYLGDGRKILAFADPEAAKPFKVGKKWVADCLRANKIEVRLIPLSPTLRKKVRAAQQRQSR